MKQYQITLKIKTAILPKDIIWFVTQKLKGVLPIISINYEVIEDRETTIEHHGGIDEESIRDKCEEDIDNLSRNGAFM